MATPAATPQNAPLTPGSVMPLAVMGNAKAGASSCSGSLNASATEVGGGALWIARPMALSSQWRPYDSGQIVAALDPATRAGRPGATIAARCGALSGPEANGHQMASMPQRRERLDPATCPSQIAQTAVYAPPSSSLQPSGAGRGRGFNFSKICEPQSSRCEVLQAAGLPVTADQVGVVIARHDKPFKSRTALACGR